MFDHIGFLVRDADVSLPFFTACLRPLGMMVSFGNASGPVAIPDLGVLARKGSLFVTRPTGATYFATREDLVKGAAALFADSGAATPSMAPLPNLDGSFASFFSRV